MHWGILGPLEVRADDRILDLGGPKQRAVLAFLLVHVNEVVALDRLIDGLWGDAPPARATATLQVFISNLRRVIEPGRPPRAPAAVLLTRPPGYLLRLAAQDFDAARFEQLAEEGRRLLLQGAAPAAHDALTGALSLWRGPALAEFADEPFARPEANRLEGLRLLAIEDRVQAAMDLGRHREAVGELEALVAEHPLRERLWGMLMLAQYRAGSQADALRSFQRARRRLGEELGIEPGPALRQLERDILAHSPAIDWRPARDAVGPPATAEGRSRTPPGRTPLVGRQEQLRRLDGALHDALGGRGRVVLLSGEPGIGKTRLAQELVHHAEDAGALVAWGACFDGDPPPFWPWVQVLRTVLAAPDGDSVLLPWERGALTQLLPELQDAGAPALAPPDPAQARFHLYSAVTSVLLRVTAGRPLCIVLDDLHSADPPSLQLLGQLVARCGAARLVLAGTYRDTEGGDDLAQTVAELVRDPAADHVSLSGLAVDEVAQFVTNTTGTEPSPGLAESLHHRTEGNPFFLTELVRLLESEHALDADDARAVPAEVPPGVRDVIRRRLARLPEQTNVLLTIGAVAGTEFDHRLLETIGGLGEERTLELMEVAIVTGIVTDPANHVGRYRFSHPLIRQTIYEGLSTVRRARLHARVAEGIRAVQGDSAVVDVANHLWAAAGEADAEATLPIVLRAAEVTLGQLAYEQAAEQLKRAAALLQRDPEDLDAARQELVLQLRLVQLLAMATGSRSPQTEVALRRAHALTDLVGHEPEFLPALWGLFFALALRAEIDSAHRLARQFLEIADRTGDRLFRLAGHLGLSIAAYIDGDFTLAHDMATTATTLADSTSDATVAATFQMDPATVIRSMHGHLHALRGDSDTGFALVHEAITRAKALGDRVAEAIAYYCGAMSALVTEDVDRVDDMAAKGAFASAAIGFRGLETTALSFRAWVLAQRGRTEDAIAAAVESLAQFATTGNGWGWSLNVFLWADVHRDHGPREEVLRAIDEVLRPDNPVERTYESPILRLRAELLASRFPERLSEAIESAEAAVAVARRQGAPPLEARAAATLARVRKLAGAPAG
jgi:DNA-binding SARP family transcriptional activator